MFSNFEKLIENILFHKFKSRLFDFSKNGIHAKYFLLLLVFWKVAKKRYIIKPFNRITGLLPRIYVSKKFPTLYFFKECSKKLLFLKFWNIPRKNSSVEILLSGSSCLKFFWRNLSCPIYHLQLYWKMTPPRTFPVSVTREQKFLKVIE